MDMEQFLDQPTLGFFVDGQFVSPAGHPECELLSPTTNQPWKAIIPANAHNTEQAIEAAKKAYESWKMTPAPLRGDFLRKIGDLMLQYEDDFAQLMAKEMGKPITQGKGEVAYAAKYFHWYAGEAERIYGMTIPSQFKGKKLMIIHEPVGVCAAITPWNFPLAIPARKLAPALAAGCPVINKPSPETPVIMLLFAHICQMAELPPGTVNIIPGPEQEIGETLLNSPTVRKLSFTGSTSVGRYLYHHSAKTLKKLTLELGGHAPALIFDDADLDKAIEGTIQAKFRNNGQTCTSPNRILVQESIHETFVKKLIDAIGTLRLGDPLDPKSDLSTVLHPSSIEKVNRHVQDALDKGAKVELMGKTPHEPTVLSHITPDMVIFYEETFGPVVPISTFDTDEEGIAMANHSEFGLASYVFTESYHRINRVIEALEYGIVSINDGQPSTYQASFGGIKSSGFGREGGPKGIEEYLVEKFISIC